jgi:serine/threonine protein kinase
MCTPSSRNEQTEKDLERCTPLKGVDLLDTVQLIMPLGGKPLFFVPHRVSSIKFFPMCQHLLEMGALLLSKGIVHYDVHSLNLLCDSPSSIKLIDFGISWMPEKLTLANVSNLYRQFTPKAEQVPPEISLLHGIEEYPDKSNEYLLSRIHDDKLTLQLMYKLFGISVESQIQSLRDFSNNTWSFREKHWYSFFSLYWSKIDSWAIGVILLTLFVDISMDPNFESSIEYKDKITSTLNIIKGLCDTHPAKRIDSIEALEIYAPNSSVLQLPEIQAWLEKQKTQRAMIKKILL